MIILIFRKHSYLMLLCCL